MSVKLRINSGRSDLTDQINILGSPGTTLTKTLSDQEIKITISGGSTGSAATTVQTERVLDHSASAVGSSNNYAREDHTHGTPAMPAASDVGAVPTTRTVSTTAPLQGGGALSGNLSLTVDAATTSAVGVVRLATPSADTTAGRVVQASDTRLSDSRAPTGTAGGALAGTYPNPTLVSASILAALPLTTKGDLLAYDTAANRLGVGTTATGSDGPYFINADSTQGLGLKWINGYARQILTTPGYNTITMPDRKICKRVQITFQGSGYDGVVGGTGAGTVAGGKAGGSGARTFATWARSQLPDTLYGFVGSVNAAGKHTFIELVGTQTYTLSSLNDAGIILGYAISAVATGNAVAALNTGSIGLRNAFMFQAWGGTGGSNGGASGTPTAITIGSTSQGINLPGCPGAGKTLTVAANGGGYSAAASPLGALAGGTAPGGAGNSGTYGGGSASGYTTASSDIGELLWCYGGLGGASEILGTGGKGGDGALGCGGGGGGAGTVAGGAGGAGGTGYILLEYFAF